MIQLTEWLWRRYRPHWVGVVYLALNAALAFVVTASGLILQFFFEVSAREITAGIGGITAASFVTTAIALRLLRDDTRALRAWLHDAESDTEVAWDEAIRVPRLAVRRAVPLVFVGCAGTVLPITAVVSDSETPTAMVTLGLVVVIIFAAVSVLAVTVLQLLLYPATRDLTRENATLVLPAIRGTSLRTTLLVSIGAVTLLAGIWITSFVLGGEANVSYYPRTAIVATTVALVMTAAVDFALVEPLLVQVRDLLDATRRVRDGNYTEPVPAVAADDFGELAVAFNQMQAGLRERESLHAAFGSYVDPVLTQRLLDQGDSVFAGEEVDVTVFFVDVRDFTSYAESLTASEAVARLNELFEVIVPIIASHGGHANHYLGDGLLAVFGTPNPLPAHAAQAVAAARAIQDAVVAHFGEELRLGIGINSGTVIAGSVGGGGRLEFTVIGDVVNVAARLEQHTKETGDRVLLTEATANEIHGFRGTDRGEIALRGRTATTRLYAL